MTDKILLCDCLGTQTIDREGLQSATGLTCSRVHTGLCMQQLNIVAEAMKAGPVTVACGQEMQTFEELAEDLDLPAPGFVDLRDRAGWSDEGANALPKMAALLRDATGGGATGASRSIDVTSYGQCLVIGSHPTAREAATALADHLSVTLLCDSPEPPLDRAFDVVGGRLRRASGSLGRFEVVIDGFTECAPGGRAPALSDPRDGAATNCDLIVDLSGGQPLFPAPEKRDGYLRADPGDPLAVGRLILEASHMTGTFEKPMYVRLEESLCAHSRAGQTACTRCLDACPTGAITPDGDHVSVDPLICAGCGSCSALCPSGAITYDAPAPDALFRRIERLARSYRSAGGTSARLLVHDTTHGRQMIQLAARHGRGLPADVIPLELEQIGGFGHAEVLAALASGFGRVQILTGPRTETTALDFEMRMLDAMLESAADGTPAAALISPADPDALCDLLYGEGPAAPLADPVLPMGGRREVTRLSLKALVKDHDTPIPLPDGAPYGAVLVDQDACTLCLSCAGLCPSGALMENPDKPQLRFQESACLQCGLCANICPEKAITLTPQMTLGDAAFAENVMKEEEPYPCIECGALFGVKSTIERIVSQLEGKHPMFAESAQGRMIRMCDDCRVRSQMHSDNNPFAGKPRPKPRTTDDYLN